MSDFNNLIRRVNAITAIADSPATEDRAGAYKQCNGLIEGYLECGAINKKQFLQILRDLADNWYAYDEEDLAERERAQEEAEKDAFLAGNNA